MAHIQNVQKKTSTMSLTISSSSAFRGVSSCSSTSSSSSSSILTQKHSSLVQPLCASPQRTQSPLYNQQYPGTGVAPTFVKCLHDISTVKGQLVVLECRLRGTPPLQVLWYRDDEQILDSDDFRILRKKANSTSVPEELCTLVITEAFPEDSGFFKCMALNSFGTVSCSAVLEVYNDVDEQLENEAILQEGVSLRQEQEVMLQQEQASASRETTGSIASPLPEPMNLLPPDWPNSPMGDSPISNTADFPEPQVANHSSEEPCSCGEVGSTLSEDQRSLEVTIPTGTPSSPPPLSPPLLAEVNEKAPILKLFTPNKLSFTYSSQSAASNMNLSDLPTFTPSAFPPSGFNYERPRHFIQSQPAFQAPSYESVQREAQQNLNSTHNHQNQVQNSPILTEPVAQSQVITVQSQSVSRSLSQTQSQFQTLDLNQNQMNGTSSKSSASSSNPSLPISTPYSSAPPPPNSNTAPTSSFPTSSSSTLSRPSMRSTIKLVPSVPSAMGLGSATLPANSDATATSAAFLCSILPSPSSSFTPYTSSKLSSSSTLPQTSSPTCSSLPQSTSFQGRTSSSSSSFLQGLPVSPSLPSSPLSLSTSSCPQAHPPQNQNSPPPAVVSLPANYRGTPSTLPKPILKKCVTPRPSSSRSTDEDIQGSKDALIQDLEKQLRSKEAKRRSSQKLSYEERMARRLLGPDNASNMFDSENLIDSQLDQSDSSAGRQMGGLWGKHHLGTDERGNEGSGIQEKCYAPRFLQIPPDLTVEEGRFCRIDFKVGGLPAPDISWYLDGKAIRPDDYHKMLVCEKGMHSFIIEIVTVHHAGVYECVAKNRGGESRFSMRLDVMAQEALRPPTFVQKMLNSRVLEGDTVRLECKVDASPPPQLFWKKDKDMLHIDPNRMSLYQDGTGRQCLLIERVMKSDAGWYTLSAINEAGMSTCNTRLDVGTRTVPAMKTAPPGSKTLKLLSSLNRLPTLTVDSPAQHTVPLYESEEL